MRGCIYVVAWDRQRRVSRRMFSFVWGRVSFLYKAYQLYYSPLHCIGFITHTSWCVFYLAPRDFFIMTSLKIIKRKRNVFNDHPPTYLIVFFFYKNITIFGMLLICQCCRKHFCFGGGGGLKFSVTGRANHGLAWGSDFENSSL